MAKTGENITTLPVSRMRYYADILNPLFWNDDFNEVHRMFEWACMMVRVTGMKDAGSLCIFDADAGGTHCGANMRAEISPPTLRMTMAPYWPVTLRSATTLVISPAGGRGRKVRSNVPQLGRKSASAE